MRTFVSLAAAAALAVGVSIGAQSAQATTLTFTPISSNSADDDVVDVGNQLFVDVASALVNGVAGVSFTFTNAVGVDSWVSAVYFDADGYLGSVPPGDEGVLGGASGFVETPVNFSQGATPPGLPSGGGLTSPFSTSFAADADNNPPDEKMKDNGINEANDWLTIFFELASGQSFTDITNALMTGDLRIGMQVQSIGAGEVSAQYINNPTPVPLPAGLVLFLSGLAGVGFLGRYKARRQETAVA